jgi:hypothetical protein
MPNTQEEAPGKPRAELIVDLIDRIDRQFAEQAVSHVLGKLPKHHHKALWFEACRTDRAAMKRAAEDGGTR